MKLKGTISIGRLTGGGEEPEVRIHIEDDLSGCRVLDIRMTMADYGNCVSGLSNVPCVMEYASEAPIGKKREHMEKVIVVPPCSLHGDALRKAPEVLEQLKELAKDGWEPRRDDLGNHHRWDGRKHGYRVTFTRHVDAR